MDSLYFPLLVDSETKAKIDGLLRELRSWELDEPRYTVWELVEIFNLPPVVIQRIAFSEGFDLAIGEKAVDPNAITQSLEPKDVPDD